MGTLKGLSYATSVGMGRMGRVNFVTKAQTDKTSAREVWRAFREASVEAGCSRLFIQAVPLERPIDHGLLALLGGRYFAPHEGEPQLLDQAVNMTALVSRAYCLGIIPHRT